MDIVPATLAPEFREIAGWANSSPLSIRGLKGKVLLLDCWTYTCIFCLRTVPIMRRLQEKYGKYGFQVIQAHSAEYQFATNPANIRRALDLYKVGEPVAFDTNNKTWEEYGNMYWPKHIMIDHNGFIRYEHAGYGSIQDFEEPILELLQEAGQQVSDEMDKENPQDWIYDTYGMHFYGIAPEICVGYSRLRRFGNSQTIKPDTANIVTDAGSHDVNVVYLRGKWIWHREGVQFASGGKEQIPAVIMRYQSARKVHAIIGSTDAKPARIEIKLDGNYLTSDELGKHATLDGKSSIAIVEWPFMHNLVQSEKPEMHEIEIIPRSENFMFYTFVFG